MSDFRSITCPICSGQRYIFRGRNIDNKTEKQEPCPHCNAKGVIYVDISNWDKKTRKRFEAKQEDNNEI